MQSPTIEESPYSKSNHGNATLEWIPKSVTESGEHNWLTSPTSPIVKGLGSSVVIIVLLSFDPEKTDSKTCSIPFNTGEIGKNKKMW
jgi:hypothetical protein